MIRRALHPPGCQSGVPPARAAGAADTRSVQRNSSVAPELEVDNVGHTPGVRQVDKGANYVGAADGTGFQPVRGTGLPPVRLENPRNLAGRHCHAGAPRDVRLRPPENESRRVCWNPGDRHLVWWVEAPAEGTIRGELGGSDPPLAIGDQPELALTRHTKIWRCNRCVRSPQTRTRAVTPFLRDPLDVAALSMNRAVLATKPRVRAVLARRAASVYLRTVVADGDCFT